MWKSQQQHWYLVQSSVTRTVYIPVQFLFFFASHCAAQMPHIVVLLFAKFLWKNHPWLILTLLLNRRQVCDPKRICPSLLEIYFFMAFSKCSHEQKGVPSKVPSLKRKKKTRINTELFEILQKWAIFLQVLNPNQNVTSDLRILFIKLLL